MPRQDAIVEDFHGTKVSDPYRYLEDDQDPDTLSFIAAQAARAEAFLSAIPSREAIKQRLTELWDYPKFSVPRKVAGKYYYLRNAGLQNQAVFYSLNTLGSAPEMVLDPNTFSSDGTVALTATSVSEDGKLLAYACSESGSDWQRVYIKDLESGQTYDDVLRHVKFTGLSWLPDSSGFFYSRFPDPATVPPEEQSYHSKIYFHRVGTDQLSDELIYERPEAKELGFAGQVSEDGSYLYIYVWHGTDPENRFYYQSLAPRGETVRLLDDADASYEVLGNDGHMFYFLTNLEAPHGRVIAIDILRPERANWKEIIAATGDTIADAKFYNRKFVVTYLTHAHHQVAIYSQSGRRERGIELPTLGSLISTTGQMKDSEMFLSFTSFLFPTTVYRYDFTDHTLSPLWAGNVKFDPTDYETKQEFCISPDGTRIPLFITHKKGLARSHQTPTLLYGYGGFNVNMTPFFSVDNLVWMERGGVYALAVLRGGGEYGENWHRAGMLAKKQNVFDDFHAAARHLVSAGYTSPRHLAIMGGSNGGLLVAACMLQRPELYGAVICQVPVIDMLRYHKFTVGRYWVGEYGNAEASEEHFKFMHAYSPLHNVKSGVDYPPTLIMTADTDDRVVPAHAFKFMATLEEHYQGQNPLLLRIEIKAGHGAGKPTAKIIDEDADIYAFLTATIC